MRLPDRRELGDFLRSRRRQLRADDAASDRRRRTPGLRREEVAERAGIGVDWYTRLEQGRPVNPSEATIAALASALELSASEHVHLRALARPAERPAFEREKVSPGLRRLVASLVQPAYVCGRRFDVLTWNDAAAALLGDFGAVPQADRNIVVYLMTDPAARVLFKASWPDEARRIVAQFRSIHDLWAGDPAFTSMSDRLRHESAEFARLWEAHEVRLAQGGIKTLHHPVHGPLRFEHASFQANDDPRLRLVIYRPA